MPSLPVGKFLEGRCSVSDITTKISPSFQRRALPCPLLARDLAPFSPMASCPTCFIHCWVCQQEHPLVSSLPACLSFSPFLPIWPTKVLQMTFTQRPRDNKRLEKKNPLTIWFDCKWICHVARDVVTGPASSFLGEFSDSPAWFFFFFSPGWVFPSIIHLIFSVLGSAFSL